MTRAIVILNKLIISPHVKEKNENMNDYQEVDLNQIHFLFLQKLPYLIIMRPCKENIWFSYCMTKLGPTCFSVSYIISLSKHIFYTGIYGNVLFHIIIWIFQCRTFSLIFSKHHSIFLSIHTKKISLGLRWHYTLNHFIRHIYLINKNKITKGSPKKHFYVKYPLIYSWIAGPFFCLNNGGTWDTDLRNKTGTPSLFAFIIFSNEKSQADAVVGTSSLIFLYVLNINILRCFESIIEKVLYWNIYVIYIKL